MLREYDRLYTEAVELAGIIVFSCFRWVRSGNCIGPRRQYRNEQYGRSESARLAVATMGLTVTRNTKKEDASLKNVYVGVSDGRPG
jgi:hypothetical protein